MAKVNIVEISEEGRYKISEVTQVFVDGELVGEGFFGGEPEDNVRYRDYNWVTPLIRKLAEKLGAEVDVHLIMRHEEE